MTCARRWGVEAYRDGRLLGTAGESFARHLASCSECRAEVRRLDELTEAIRALPVRMPDMILARRQRERLLEAAERESLGDPTPSTARSGARFALLIATSLALVTSAVAARYSWVARQWAAATASAAAPLLAPAMPPVEVVATEGTTWTRTRQGAREVLSIHAGTVSLRVPVHPPETRVVVRVPDGEIEDIGTSFIVRVNDGRTALVSVSEGKVVLHLNDAPLVVLGAGESWERGEANPAPVTQTQAPASPQPNRARGPLTESAPVVDPPAPPGTANSARGERTERGELGSAARGVASGVPGEPRALAGRTTAPGAPWRDQPPAVAGVDAFRAGADALRAGNNGLAAELLEGFLAAASRDPRVEDAAYLRTVALERAGRKSEARAAASAYLQRFPHGFRRREIEALRGD